MTENNSDSEIEIDQDLKKEITFYDNDFDLSTLLDQMKQKQKLKTNHEKSSSSITISRCNKHKKPLTAHKFESHFTDGKHKWQLYEQGIDLYRSSLDEKYSSQSDSLIELDFSEQVYIDIQPLSTCLKLMCKLIIIIQGQYSDSNFQASILDNDNSNQTLKSNNKTLSKSCENIQLNELKVEDEDKEREEEEEEERVDISIFETPNQNANLKK
jgi:hypothetical protein